MSRTKRKANRTEMSRRVDEALAKLKATRQQLCKALRIHHMTLYSIERGRHFGATGKLVERFLAMGVKGQKEVMRG